MTPWLRLRHKLPRVTAWRGGRPQHRRRRDCADPAVPTADVLVNNLGIFNDKDSLAFRMMSGCTSITSTSSPASSGASLCARHDGTGLGADYLVSSESGVAIPGDMINYGVTKPRIWRSLMVWRNDWRGPVCRQRHSARANLYRWPERDAGDAAAQSGRSAREQADEFVKTRVRAPSSSVRRMWKK